MQYGKRSPLIDTFSKWNSKINLSGIKTPAAIYEKHILDSLEVENVIDFKPGKKLLDVGTGGGFPLLPLAINHPDLHCTGLDARRKKVRAVQSIADQLGIENVTTIWSRAEEYDEQYDYVTARAVSYIDQLLERTTHLVKSGGNLLLYKKFTLEEDGDLQQLLNSSQLVLQDTHRYDDDRVIYNLQKT